MPLTPSGNERCILYLVRHGDSRRDKVKRYIGQRDPSLNPRGRAQARFLQLQLAGIDFTRVYCSDLRRCRETARIVAGRRGLRIRPVSDLREIALGTWDGLAMHEVRRRFPDAYECRGRDIFNYRPPSGESFADLKARVIPVFLDIMYRETGPVLLVGHAGVNRVILHYLLNRPADAFFDIRQVYGCLNIIERQGKRMIVREINIRPEPEAFSRAGCAALSI
jgi:probable phosphoglycerate mutase